MISDFVSTLTTNCDSMSEIVSNAYSFSNNNDKLPTYEKSINSSLVDYDMVSRKAIVADLSKIVKDSVNWSYYRNKLNKLTKDAVIEPPVIEPIKLESVPMPVMHLESLPEMIRCSALTDKTMAASYKKYKNNTAKYINSFPAMVTEYENQMVSIRNDAIPAAKKLANKLLQEHRRYVQASVFKLPFVKLDGIDYIDSQKEFINTNIRKLITFQ